MSNTTKSLTCAAVCWALAALVGSLAAAVLMVLASWTFMQGLFSGAVIAVVLGIILSVTLCRPLPAPGELRAAGAAAGQAQAKSAAPASSPAPSASPAPAAPAAAAPAPAAAPEPAPEPEPEPAPEPTPAPEPAQAAPATSAPAEPGPGTRPEALEGPRGGTADDLKRIKGVGPKLEKLLHSLGFFHFDQVAAWTADEVAWVDQNLTGFKGRVSRDNWVEQAKLLAAGGETEFSRKVDEGDVY